MSETVGTSGTKNAAIRAMRGGSALAVGCALAAGALLGGCASSTSSSATSPGGLSSTFHGTAPIPSTTAGTTGSTGTTTGTTSTSPAASAGLSTTPTPAGSAEFLRQSELPDYPAYGWKQPELNEVNVEHPLPGVCGTSLGPQVTHGVREADFGARDPDVTAVEDVYTYASGSDARARLTASTPKCGGVTATTADGFAWRGAGHPGLNHVLFVVKGDKLATLVITPGSRDYDASADARLLSEMAQHLG